MPVQVEVTITPDLDKLTRALRRTAEGKLIKNEMARALREIGKDVVRIERESIMETPITADPRGTKPSGKGGGKGIRRPIANSIVTRNRLTTTQRTVAGIEVRVSKSALPEGLKNIPSAMERRGGWRHPVFGNRDVWVRQKAPDGWWTRGKQRALPMAEAKGIAAMQRAERRMREELGMR